MPLDSNAEPALDATSSEACSTPISTRAIETTLGKRLLGKPHAIRLALTCVLAHGHLLIDDVPGVGKTTLARGLAEALGLSFSRIQFTSDVLPGDILGVSIFDRAGSAFEFRPGPIFAELVLADEINRANPRTQSALLEAMAENQVTIEGETRCLGSAFTVVATQNGVDQSGTHALPESQLDRFLMRISIGYPPHAAEKSLLAEARSQPAEHSDNDNRIDLAAWRAEVRRIRISDALTDYLLALIEASRSRSEFVAGLSPRAGLALQRSAQAFALLSGRDFVQPEDVQAVLPAVVDHRLSLQTAQNELPSDLLRRLVPVL